MSAFRRLASAGTPPDSRCLLIRLALLLALHRRFFFQVGKENVFLPLCRWNSLFSLGCCAMDTVTDLSPGSQDANFPETPAVYCGLGFRGFDSHTRTRQARLHTTPFRGSGVRFVLQVLCSLKFRKRTRCGSGTSLHTPLSKTGAGKLTDSPMTGRSRIKTRSTGQDKNIYDLYHGFWPHEGRTPCFGFL